MTNFALVLCAASALLSSSSSLGCLETAAGDKNDRMARPLAETACPEAESRPAYPLFLAY